MKPSRFVLLLGAVIIAPHLPVMWGVVVGGYCLAASCGLWRNGS